MKKISLILIAVYIIFVGSIFLAHAAPITPIYGGGTGTSTIPGNGQILIGDGTKYIFIASSSLGSGGSGGGVATSSPVVGFVVFKDGNTITGTSTIVQSLSNNSASGGVDFSAATGTGITGVLHSLAISQFTNDSGYVTATTSPAGSDKQLQYNNGGSFGAISNLTNNSSTGQVRYLGTGSDNPGPSITTGGQLNSTNGTDTEALVLNDNNITHTNANLLYVNCQSVTSTQGCVTIASAATSSSNLNVRGNGQLNRAIIKIDGLTTSAQGDANGSGLAIDTAETNSSTRQWISLSATHGDTSNFITGSNSGTSEFSINASGTYRFFNFISSPFLGTDGSGFVQPVTTATLKTYTDTFSYLTSALQNASITASSPIQWSGGSVISCPNCAVTNADNNFSTGQTFNGNNTTTNEFVSSTLAVSSTTTILGPFADGTNTVPSVGNGLQFFVVNASSSSLSPYEFLNPQTNPRNDISLLVENDVDGKGAAFRTRASSTFSRFESTNLAFTFDWFIGDNGSTNWSILDAKSASTPVPFVITLGTPSSTLVLGSSGQTILNNLSQGLNSGLQATNKSLLQMGNTAISGGNGSGTYIGINEAAGFNGDFADFQANGAKKFEVASSGFTSFGAAIGFTTTSISITSCGGGASTISGSNAGGLIKTASSTQSCGITFSPVWKVIPVCIAQVASGTANASATLIMTTLTTNATITAAFPLASSTWFNYICHGNPN